MSDSTNLNEYLEAFRAEVESLDSVRVCELYGGQLEADDINKIKVDLRVPEKCHVFIDIAGMVFEKDQVHNKVYANTNILCYIVGEFDRRTKGHSLDCANTSTDIINLINSKANQIVRPQPGFVQLGDSGQLVNAIRDNNRFSIWYVSFTQRIRL